MSSGNIIVTGFGPFWIHFVNASWETVKLLPDEIDGYNVIKEEIPVVYEAVDSRIPALWEEYNPELAVHLGVSSYTQKIQLETCAHKDLYQSCDVYGKRPLNGSECAAASTEKCIQTGLNLEDICIYVNNHQTAKVCTSNNAGRYLCEYILYTSLSFDKNKAIFLHVPEIGEPYTVEELADAVLEIIRCALRQRQCK